MKVILAAALCTAAIISSISTASAQYSTSSGSYYYPPDNYYYYGSPAGIFNVPAPESLGWNYTRNQPVGYGESYPALRMPDGTLACEHGNYRPIRGWCKPVCCSRPVSP